jgi:hypothetical protein
MFSVFIEGTGNIFQYFENSRSAGVVKHPLFKYNVIQDLMH